MCREAVRQPNIFLYIVFHNVSTRISLIMYHSPSRALRHLDPRVFTNTSIVMDGEKYGGVCGRAPSPITSPMTQVAVPIRKLSSSTPVRTGVRAVPLSMLKHGSRVRSETAGQTRPRRISRIRVTSIDGGQVKCPDEER
jgi:hypothetical protein